MADLHLILGYAGGLFALLGASAFFSGSETALFSLSRTEVKRMGGGSRGERAVKALLARTQKLLTTILIGNMLVNVLIASLVAGLARRLFSANSVGAAIGISTFLLLIFGEVTPKTIAIFRARAWAVLAAPILLVFGRLTAPLRFILELTVNSLLFLVGHAPIAGWNPLTREEVIAMSAAGTEAGAATKEEHLTVERLLEFAHLEGHDIMMPRTEIKGIKDSLTLRQAYAEARHLRYSRLPVFTENMDDIWGLISIVDLPRWRNSELMSLTLAELRSHADSPVHPVTLVPETARLNQLLQGALAQQAHLLVLVDEYGGTAGIVTLHGILAAIMGEVAATKQRKQKIVQTAEHSWFVEGRTHLRELNEELPVPLEINDTDTVGGYVMERLGRIAHAGDETVDSTYSFRVLSMIDRRIGLVQMQTLTPADKREESKIC